VETEMVLGIGLNKLEGLKMLKSIDIAEAVIYALSAPQRVNVSRIRTNLITQDIFLIIDVLHNKLMKLSEKLFPCNFRRL